jgi:hypothetical protein
MKNKEERIAVSWENIMLGLKLISDKQRRLCMHRLLDCYKEKFLSNPAAVRHHHVRVGGLCVHTSQVLDLALQLFHDFRAHMPTVTMENVYVAVILHDLSKTQCYRMREDAVLSPASPFEYAADWKYEHDIWTLSEAARFGLLLSYDEMMGVMQAHGGWAKLNDPVNKLAVIVHCADMISSQLLKQ